MNILVAELSTLPEAETENRFMANSRALRGALAAGLAFIMKLPKRQRQVAELAGFSDRELADIGLNRADVSRVYSGDFAADYAASRSRA